MIHLHIIEVFILCTLNILYRTNGQFINQYVNKICFQDAFYIFETCSWDDTIRVESTFGRCDGLSCGDVTYDKLNDGFKELLFAAEKIAELEQKFHINVKPGLQESGTIPESVDHDNDKCCPTAQYIESKDNLHNVKGKLMTLVQYDNFRQVIPVGECVDVPRGCSKCHQEKRLHFLLALDPDTNEISLDMFYVNSHCVCVQN